MIASIPSAGTISVLTTVVEISGTDTVNTILGVSDGQVLKVWPTDAWAFGAAGNIVASAAPQVSGTPVFLFQRNGVLTQVGVRPDSPTLVTPTIASFANAAHNHENAAGGGQITPAAINGTTGTGNVVRTSAPTIDDPTITTRIRLPGPVYIYSGTGAPAFAAPISSTFHRTDGGAGTSLYVNETGLAGGWVGK